MKKAQIPSNIADNVNLKEMLHLVRIFLAAVYFFCLFQLFVGRGEAGIS